jgi:hypothetical protein
MPDGSTLLLFIGAGAVLVSLPGPAVIYERTLTKLSGCVFIGLGLSSGLVGTASHLWSAPDQDLGMDGIGPSSSMPC